MGCCLFIEGPIFLQQGLNNILEPVVLQQEIHMRGYVRCSLYLPMLTRSRARGRLAEVSGATLTADRFEAADAAYSFDGDDVITVATPFTAGDQDFSVSVW